MKLIISEMDALSSYVSTQAYHLMKTLIEHYDWINIDRYRLWKEPGSLRDKLVGRLGRIPDVILLWEGYDFVAAHREALMRLDCYKCFFTVDLHCRDNKHRQRKRSAFELCDVIIGFAANVFSDFYPGVARRKKIVWVPHSASPFFMLAFNEQAENAIFLSGAISDVYPLRQQMKALRKNPAYSIVYHPHPGYYTGYNYERDARVGKGYARKINTYRVGFTDASIYKYLVGKHVEIPAVGALLLAERAVRDGLRELGFVEDVHYVSVSSEDMEEKIRYLLNEENHPALDQIRRRGQALVWDRHKTNDRAKLIDEVVENRS